MASLYDLFVYNPHEITITLSLNMEIYFPCNYRPKSISKNGSLISSLASRK